MVLHRKQNKLCTAKINDVLCNKLQKLKAKQKNMKIFTCLTNHKAAVNFFTIK